MHNSQTATAFLVKNSKDFNKEKVRLIAYLQRIHMAGAASFHRKELHSFGPLSMQEWNILLYKHIDRQQAIWSLGSINLTLVNPNFSYLSQFFFLASQSL